MRPPGRLPDETDQSDVGARRKPGPTARTLALLPTAPRHQPTRAAGAGTGYPAYFVAVLDSADEAVSNCSSLRRTSLPVALRGNSTTNTTSRGTLWRARLALT